MRVYPFIEAERAERRNVKRACVLLEVSRAAFYDWARRVPTRRQRRDQELLQKIETVHEDSKGTYGSTPSSGLAARSAGTTASPG